MKNKIMYKITSLAVIISLSLTTISYNKILADTNENTYSQVINVNNTEYDITAYDVADGRNVIVETADKKYEILVDKKNEEICLTQYKYMGTSFLGTKKYDKTNEKIVSTDDENIVELVSQMSWGSKTTCKWCTNYYYCWGNSKYGNTYLKIGCKADYSLKYYSFEQWKKDMCKNDYVGNINKSNNAYNKALASGTAADIAAASALLAAIGLPFAGAVGVLVGALGVGVTFASNCVDAHDYSGKAADAYEIIKKWGNKI